MSGLTPEERRPPRGPRIIAEEGAGARPAERLDFGWEQEVAAAPPPAPPKRWSALALFLGGLGVLLFGLSLLETANFVADQFARGEWLGWITLAVAVLGFGLIIWAALRELNGLWQLKEVDRARASFAAGDYVTARVETLAWAARTPAAKDSLPALRGANDLDQMVRILEDGPLEELDRASAAAGRAAAMQAFAATAVVPSPALDALFFVWRGFRLVREVAAIHGMRPGIAGTLALLRRTFLEAGVVGVADVALDAATRAVISNPLLAKLTGEAGQGAIAARRMIMLGRATGRVCRILPPPEK